MINLSEAELLVTTPPHASVERERSAVELADRLGSVFAVRGNRTIRRLLQRHRASAAIVAGVREMHLVYHGRRYGFHPNMALSRMIALRDGGRDRLVEVAALKAGERFLDCTCGLAADAVVAAYALGEAGVVRALESSAALAAIVGCGLRHYGYKDVELVAAMRRVDVLAQDYTHLLPTLETNSWDVVYFDPMFETGLSDSGAIDLVRILGKPGLPSSDAITQARRVAARCVVIKDRKPGRFLTEMGIEIVSAAKRVWYGRLDAFPADDP